MTTRCTKDPASKQSEILIFFFKEPGQNDPGHHASKICTFNMTLATYWKSLFFFNSGKCYLTNHDYNKVHPKGWWRIITIIDYPSFLSRINTITGLHETFTTNHQYIGVSQSSTYWYIGGSIRPGAPSKEYFVLFFFTLAGSQARQNRGLGGKKMPHPTWKTV